MGRMMTDLQVPVTPLPLSGTQREWLERAWAAIDPARSRTAAAAARRVSVDFTTIRPQEAIYATEENLSSMAASHAACLPNARAQRPEGEHREPSVRWSGLFGVVEWTGRPFHWEPPGRLSLQTDQGGRCAPEIQ